MITPNTTILLTMLALTTALGVQTTESPFFCNLEALTPAERTQHLGLTGRLLPAIRDSRETSDGYAFDFDARRVTLKDLATWVDFERRCCPFFDFQIDWRRESGPLTLRLAGRPGVKEFIRSEFKAAFH